MKYFSFLFLIGSLTFAQIKPLIIEPLNDKLFVYQSFNHFKGVEYNANAMYLVTKDGVVLFDVPWQESQYQTLLDSIKVKHQLPVIAVFVTHSHEDRAGDLSFFNALNIRTYASAKTNHILREQGRAEATHLIEIGKTYKFGKEKFAVEFFGEGHTSDNLTIWFPKYKVLNGGCLVKGSAAENLGNVAEANLYAWPKTINEISQKHPKIKQVIPGHDAWRGEGHLSNTLKLLELN